MADFTKARGQLLDWTELVVKAADGSTSSPYVKSDALTITDDVSVTLYITVAHADTGAAATSYVYVKCYSLPGTTATEDWRLCASLQAGGGTAVTEAVAAESAAAQNTILVAAITDWDTGLQERIFVKDATLVNSEVVTIIGWNVDAGNDWYICAENLANTHADTADLFSGVDEMVVHVPEGSQAVKVIFTNSALAGIYAVRVDYEKVTDIE